MGVRNVKRGAEGGFFLRLRMLRVAEYPRRQRTNLLRNVVVVSELTLSYLEDSGFIERCFYCTRWAMMAVRYNFRNANQWEPELRNQIDNHA